MQDAEDQELKNSQQLGQAQSLAGRLSETATEKGKKINWWKISTVVFALLFFGITGVYVLNLQTGRKQTGLLIPSPQPTNYPTSTTASSPSPTQITADPTASWETYTTNQRMDIDGCYV